MTTVDVVKVIAEECGKGFDTQRKKAERSTAEREDIKTLEEMRGKLLTVSRGKKEG